MQLGSRLGFQQNLKHTGGVLRAEFGRDALLATGSPVGKKEGDTGVVGALVVVHRIPHKNRVPG